jgi:hypothetical protein
VKAALALIFMLPLFFAMLQEAKAVQYDYGQFEGLPYDPPLVTIKSPSPNGTYHVSDAPLNVTVQIRGFIYHNLETLRWLNYSLDDQTAISMTLTEPSEISHLPYPVYGNAMLTNLSDGNHTLTIYGETAVSGLTGNFNETISFRVDTSTNIVTEAFPIFWVTAPIAIALICLALVIYLKKHKRGLT